MAGCSERIRTEPIGKMAGWYCSTLNVGLKNTFTLPGTVWRIKMLARYTRVGLLATVMTGLTAGRAGAGGGFQMLDLKSIVNMDWRDEVWGDGRGG